MAQKNEFADDAPATDRTALRNLKIIQGESDLRNPDGSLAVPIYTISDRLRAQLERAGLKGFKNGGHVEKDGIYKLHKGEYVLSHRDVEQAKSSGGSGIIQKVRK
jgi:hypothetical protein